MLLQGTIYDITERETYTRLVVVTEVGFQSDVYVFRVNPEKLQDDLKVGVGVLLTGSYTTHDGFKRFVLDSITGYQFKSCAVCKLPLTSEQCTTKHDGEVSRLEGRWTVLHKNYCRGYMELFFEKDGMVFPTSIPNKSWLYSVLDNIEEGDLVEMDGWRQKVKINVTFCRKVDCGEVI